LFSYLFAGVPRILGLSASQLVEIDSQLILTCNASGFPIPTIEWKINGTIYNRDFVHTQLIDNIVIKKLTINSMMWSNAGFYECVATNSLGTVVENVTITVEGITYHNTLYCTRSYTSICSTEYEW